MKLESRDSVPCSSMTNRALEHAFPRDSSRAPLLKLFPSRAPSLKRALLTFSRVNETGKTTIVDLLFGMYALLTCTVELHGVIGEKGR